MLKDLGLDVPLRVWTDSSAAIGICQRQGLGKVRHLDTQTLWIQQAVRAGKVDLRKIDGDKNPADLLTKHSITEARLEMLVKVFGCRYLEGRAASAPKERKGASSKFTFADAAKELNTTVPSQAEDEIVLPHIRWSAEELDQKHPSCSVPEDASPEDGREREADRSDATLQRGLRIAKSIQEEMLRLGRTKYMNERNHCELAHGLDIPVGNSLCTIEWPSGVAPQAGYVLAVDVFSKHLEKDCRVGPRELFNHCPRRSVGKGNLSARLVLGIVWRLESLPRNNVRCGRASGHVPLGSNVDHSCMPTGMRELTLPQASTEVRTSRKAFSCVPLLMHHASILWL